MPPMWTVPLRVMAGFALAAGGDGPAPVRRSAPGGRVARGFAAGGDGVGVVARSGCPGHLGGVLGLLRGDAPGQALVGALGVVDVVEAVDLLLELGDGVGQGLPARVAEQGLVEALVLALGGGPVGSAGGGVRRPGSARAPAGRAGDWAPAGARGRAVVGRAGAGCAPRAATPLSKTSMAA